MVFWKVICGQTWRTSIPQSCNPSTAQLWVYWGKCLRLCIYIQLKLWLEESFKTLPPWNIRKRMISCIVQIIFTRNAMELRNLNLDYVPWNHLPEWEKIIIVKPFKEKWWKHWLAFPWDLHRAMVQREKAHLINLLLIFPKTMPWPQ